MSKLGFVGTVGMIRIVAEKSPRADSAGDEVEVLFYETFETGLCEALHTARTAQDTVSELGVEKPAAEALSGMPHGFYELVGEVRYEFDPGFDSPNGPAEPDAWWWLDNERAQAITEEQAGWFGYKP